MKRIGLSSSVFAIVGLLVSVGPVSLAAQNARLAQMHALKHGEHPLVATMPHARR